MITEKATIIRQNRRSIKILITESGEISIYAPKHITNSDIEKLVGNKEEWATKKAQKMKERYTSNTNIIGYKNALICGKVYEIKFEKVKKIGLLDNYLLMPEKYNEKSKLISALKKWYKTLAEDILKTRAMQLSKESGLVFSDLKIGDFRAKWGSCDSTKVIKLNYKLVMTPHKLIDAVILHELVHTKVMSHSNQFYTKLISLMPEYKKYRTELKTYSYLLKMF